jgi:hypothetical protein
LPDLIKFNSAPLEDRMVLSSHGFVDQTPGSNLDPFYLVEYFSVHRFFRGAIRENNSRPAISYQQTAFGSMNIRFLLWRLKNTNCKISDFINQNSEIRIPYSLMAR